MREGFRYYLEILVMFDPNETSDTVNEYVQESLFLSKTLFSTMKNGDCDGVTRVNINIRG